MLLSYDLYVDIFIIIFVESGHGAGIAKPEIDGFGFLFERDACPWDVWVNVGEQS